MLLKEEAADIAGLVEILPKYTAVPSTESSLQISGFQCFTNLGQPNCRRGVGVYVREGFQVSVINLPIFNVPWVESVWLDINLHDKKVCIGCIYRSPSAPSLEECESSLKKIIDGMASLVSQTVASDLIIIGDFNFPSVEWVDGLGHPASGGGDSPFVSCLSDNFLHQTVEKPTRHRGDQNPSLLDLVILSDPDSLIRNEFLPPVGNSNHSVILSVLSTNSCLQTNLHPQTFIDYHEIQRELVSINWSELITSDINTSWLNVKKTLLSTEKKHSRVIYRRQPKTLPFLTKDTKRTINRKARAWKRYKKKKTQENWLRYVKAWNLVLDSVRKLKSEYEEKLATDIKANPKSFWRHVSAKSPNRHTIPDLKHSGVTHSSPIDKANLLNVQFASAFTTQSCPTIPAAPSHSVSTPMPSLLVTEEMVLSSLDKLDVNKSKGPDGLHPRLLQECRNVLASPLCRLFQLSLKNGELPTDWKTSYVTPIHKKGPKDCAENYRAISITSAVVKVLERFVNRALIQHFETNNILTPSQHGFRSGRSVDTNLIQTYEYVTSLLD